MAGARRSFRRSTFGRRGTQRRRLDWDRVQIGFGNTFVAAQSQSVFAEWIRWPADVCVPECHDEEFDGIQPEDWTLVRTRFTSRLHMVHTGASDFDFLSAGVGIIDWTWNSFLVPGVPETPLPIDGAYLDWIINVYHPFSTVATGLGGVVSETGAISPDGVGESRAQRKLSAGKGLLLVVQVVNDHLTSGANYNFDSLWRGLFKLP